MPDLITGVDFTIQNTADFDRAVAFYRDTLGLQEGSRWGDLPAQEFETGNLTIAVVQMSALTGQDFVPNPNPIALQVADFEAARAQLESKGVEFQSDTIDSGVCFQAYFTDPDGNGLGIHQRYAPRES
jgi:catechol 2,3-dioxygenase-like lactoylglutathione lyase family enzyme